MNCVLNLFLLASGGVLATSSRSDFRLRTLGTLPGTVDVFAKFIQYCNKLKTQTQQHNKNY